MSAGHLDSRDSSAHLDLTWATPISRGASVVAQMVKNLPAMQETWVWSLGQEDPPAGGNGNPLQYSCLGNPMARGEEPGGLWSMGSQRVGHDWVTNTFTFFIPLDFSLFPKHPISLQLFPQPGMRLQFMPVRWTYPSGSNSSITPLGSLASFSGMLPSPYSFFKFLKKLFYIGILLLSEAPTNTLATWCQEPTHWKRLGCW